MQGSEKKVLFTSHVAGFARFNYPYMKWFKEQGWIVHYASKGEKDIDCDFHYKIPFNRSPHSLDNIKAYKQLKNIIKKEEYDIIHCHTPMGGVVTRLAARNFRRKKAKVVYTAHGFHFYKGAPILNWLLYYPIEKLMSYITDGLIVMNQEDYDIAVRKRFKAGHIYKINSVGVNLDRFFPVSLEKKSLLRQEYGFSEKDFILICVAEFITRKNQPFLIKAMKNIVEKITNVKLVFAGAGESMSHCKEICEDWRLSEYIHFLGFRQDILQLYQISDVLVSASKQEGLPVNLLESMATGIPAVCTRIRGNVDVVQNNKTGLLFDVNDDKTFIDSVVMLYTDNSLLKEKGELALKEVEKYSLDSALLQMAEIYGKYM